MESERLELPCSFIKRIVWSTLYPQAFLRTLWVVVGYPLRIPRESPQAQYPSCPFYKLQNVYKYFFKRSSWLTVYAIGLRIKKYLTWPSTNFYLRIFALNSLYTCRIELLQSSIKYQYDMQSLEEN